MKNNNDNYSKLIKSDFNNYDTNNYFNNFIELDASAFSFIMANKLLKINDFSFINEYNLITKFINNNIKLYERYLGEEYE